MADTVSCCSHCKRNYLSKQGRVDGATVPNKCSRITDLSNDCPASEWYAIRDWIDVQRRTSSDQYGIRFHVWSALESCLLHGKSSARQLVSKIDIHETGVESAVVEGESTTQHAVVADALADTGRLWFRGLASVTGNSGHGNPMFDQSDATHTISAKYSQPMAFSLCYTAEFTAANDTDHVAFPLLFEINPTDVAYENQSQILGSSTVYKMDSFVRHPTLLCSQISTMSDYAVDWIELLDEKFKHSSIGAVIKIPPIH